MKLREFVERPDVWDLLRDYIYLIDFCEVRNPEDMQAMLMFSISEQKRQEIANLIHEINPTASIDLLIENVEKGWGTQLREAGAASQFSNFGTF